MENFINKVYVTVISVLLAIIGFFLMATYTKITETNTLVHQLQVELSAMREKEKYFLSYQEVSQLIDKKICDYHREHIISNNKKN